MAVQCEQDACGTDGDEGQFELKAAGEGVLASVSIPWSSL
jgi:hypothetical protein